MNDSQQTKTSGPEILKFKQLNLMVRRYQVTVRGREIKLTPKEFAILRTLIKNAEQVFTRQELHQMAHDDVPAVICDKTINTHIKNLKRKIANYGQYIQSVRGVGYVFTVKKQ